MLRKDHRLPADKRLTPLFSYRTDCFVAKVSPSTLPHSRFGIILSKKVAKSATERNRIRRQLMSILEEVLPQVKSGYDILFIVHAGMVTMPREALRQLLLTFFKEKKLL